MLRTAVAYADITPGESVPLMGYGDRTHNSEGIHDPLFAYAWWLKAEGREAYVWIVLDLCVLSVQSVDLLARAISERVGLAADRIMISTTHTHSGPDTVFIGINGEPWAERYYRLLVESCASAVRSAREQSHPCRIEVRSGRSELGVNRRDIDAPIDPRLLVLSLIDEQDRLCGCLFHYSCHLTVLGVDNYQISADWLGPVRQRLQRDLGCPLMFLQGAEGNVDPVSRGALDMADPDQAVGSSFAVLEELAAGMITSISEALAGESRAALTELSVDARTVKMPLRFGGLTPAQVQEKIDWWRERFASFLEIPADRVPEDWSINSMIKQQARRKNLSDSETLGWVAEQFTFATFLGIYKIAGQMIDSDTGEVSCPVRVLDFGTLTFLCAPMEILLDVAFDWQQRFSERIAAICGLFGGWIGYLPHSRNFEEARADELYETISSMFTPGASLQLLEQAEDMVRSRSAAS